MRFAPVLFAALAGLVVTADLAEAQRNDRGRGRAPTITLYDQPNYQGRSVVIDTDAENLDWVNFNDMASSIRVSGGQWEVCIDASYRGSCQVIDSDLPNMTQWAFNDRISSIRPVHDQGRRGRTRDNGVTLWSGPNFSGRSVTLIEPSDNLNRLGFNDAAQSIEVHSGEWTFCQHADYGGRCVEIDRNVRNLNTFNLNREISSATNQYRPRDDDYGYPGRPGRPGHGSNRIEGGVQGVQSVFFARPTANGYAISACDTGGYGRCGEREADALCRASGMNRAVHYGVERARGSVWSLQDRRQVRGNEALVDVLCVR